MLWEAINSYSQFYPVKIVCESCNLTIPVNVDLGKIDSHILPAEFKQPYTVALSNNKTIQLRLVTLQDEINTFEYAKEGNSSYLYGYAHSIVNDQDIIANTQMIENLSNEDFAKIIAFHETYDHGPDMKVSYTCNLCGGRGEFVLPFRPFEFFTIRTKS